MPIEAELRQRVAQLGRLRSRRITRREDRAAAERLRAAGGPRVLVVDIHVPAHDRTSGGLRMTWLLRLLRSLHCEVTLLPTLPQERREPYATQLAELGVEVHDNARDFSDFAAARAGLYDLVLLSSPAAAEHAVGPARDAFPDATLVYDTVDLHFLRVARKGEIAGEPTEADLWKAVELDCIRGSDIVATVTEDEASVVRSLAPGTRTVVLPNVHEADREARLPQEERSDLLFIGGFLHDPNVDAVRWFVGEVLPLVRAEIDTRLWVIGPDPPEEIRALASDDVLVTGYVPRVDDQFRHARVFVSPLRYGAGMKGKIGHAMTYGLPVVTTQIGAEGMDLVDGEHALIREGAEAFAEGVVTLYRDAELWQRLSDRSQETVHERWSPEAMRGRLDDLLLSATARRTRVG